MSYAYEVVSPTDDMQEGKNDFGDYALKDLRKSATVDSVVTNPFLDPINEHDDAPLLEEEEGTERPLNYSRPRQSPPRNSSASSSLQNQPRTSSVINLLTPPSSPIPNAPLIICIHGSNDSCMRSWLNMIEILYKSGHRVLLYDRAASNGDGADLKPHSAVSELCSYLYSAKLRGPFVVIAHSYGGCIARLFLQQKPKEIAGMVLVETGQETALAPQIEEQQYKKQILGDAPLSVIRGNILKGKQDDLAKATAMAKTEAQKKQLEPQRELLERWDAEDERMKKQQLALSRRSRIVQIPNVGHHPIRDAPEAVVEEVNWVFQSIKDSGVTVGARPMVQSKPSYSMNYGSGGLTRSVTNAGGGLKRGLSKRLQSTFTRKNTA